ncbi:carbohydrate kinase [Nocardiopsis sp. HNM0947]|uniref:Carbohydrate kinase n=1 Tax=Nocardiopsis coralli TaxID=2772213 RepID=A0ABR9PD80_9ACTN|nr:carbohydrate kinase [Nocardiopsis coralli]MBE3001772.1 carbohydrate kinase [Nocardiopsis coralli]
MSDPRLVVVGENVMDLLPTAHGAEVVRASPGGGPANTAVAAARLGLPTRFLARIGSDEFGARIRARLLSEGLDPEGLVEAEEPSALAMATFREDGSAHYDFRMADAADWFWRPGELPERLPPSVGAVHAASIALFREPGATLIEALMSREKDRGEVTLSVDPNIREQVIGVPDTARALALRHLAQAHLVKASDEDLGFLFPELGAEEAVRAVADLGPSLVVATLGSDGALALRRGTGTAGAAEARVPAPEVAVADTVGAGDSFMGALLHWLDRNGSLGSDPAARLAGLGESDLRALLAHAAAAAAHTVTRVGADPPTEAELGTPDRTG